VSLVLAEELEPMGLTVTDAARRRQHWNCFGAAQLS
jgi:hypothetical protein